MTQAVVDELEAVDVEEQHGTADGWIACGALHDLVDPVHEQRPVGEPRERVVERVVLELQLGRPLVGDVRHGTRDPGRAAARAPDGEPAREHPSPCPVRMAHAVLGLQVRRVAGEVGFDRRPQARHVLVVDQLEPRRRRRLARLLALAEDRVPAGR